ncbi:hypothetical protein [Psychrosphaera algicola]|uniref:Uncharacterized protein n=1 Tax=Psychrosphaera algicola TaxID=3023714 RepID=A0ABT5FF37_9GAMM|nr:hypothetical protein [Psychrosphaera sp. G1-22]MDC2889221.1 hypothetical protein [Psychrosphaera sp. G1-22]
MSHFSIAGLQLKLESGDNLDVISKHIVKTKKRFPWVDMIVLTELCTYGPEKNTHRVSPVRPNIIIKNCAKTITYG